MPTASSNVRVRGQSGKHMLVLSSSQFDPGCVKTCTSQECAELFSLSSSLSSGRKHFWFSNLRNRDGISTRRLNVGVFTRPRPVADIAPMLPDPHKQTLRWDREPAVRFVLVGHDGGKQAAAGSLSC